MSNWLIAGLFCVGLLAVGWADEKPNPPAPKPDDKDKDKGKEKGKEKKPDFRAGAVRYQVKDVDRKSTRLNSSH